MFTYEFHAMGSRIFLAVDSKEDPWQEYGGRVAARFEEWEQSFSRFRSNSELNEVNRNSGKRQQVSEPFFQVLKLALEMERWTQGVVTPAILDALLAAGYDVPFDELMEKTDFWLRQPLSPVPAVEDIEIDEKNLTIRLPKGLHLDFGGVAKGWAVHQTMLELSALAPVLVDGGGDIEISGPMRDGSAWPVGIGDPFYPASTLALVMVGKCGIATSGTDYHRWLRNGRWQHHLIDPHTGQPAQTDVISATVIASNVIVAEAASKAALILGSENGVHWLASQTADAFLLVLKDGTRLANEQFSDLKWNEKWMNLSNPLASKM